MNDTNQNGHGTGANPRDVARILRGQATSDGAGVRLTRLIGGSALADLDPFLLLDEFGSSEASDYIAGFPDHPHRGFETVTYMLEGRVRHRDNQGNEGLLVPGSVQWMTAGRGIVHSEMPEQEAGRLRGFQLWVNLPATHKRIAPRYQDIAPERIPVISRPDGTVLRVIAGTVEGDGVPVRGPVEGIVTEPVYLDVSLPAGGRVVQPLEVGHSAFVLLFEGQAGIGPRGTVAVRGDLAVLTDGDSVTIEADAAPARFLLVAARPLREPVVRYGPFVMNTRAEIIEAVNDYNAGRI